jgi:hypothetical protein
MSQPLFYSADDYLTILNPYVAYLTCKRTKNIKNLFVSLCNFILGYDPSGYGIPYFSSIDAGGADEQLIDAALHSLLILIEYKPPSKENVSYLIKGRHLSLNAIKDNLENVQISDGGS